MGPKVVQIVVFASGRRGGGAALVVVEVVGVSGWCWCWCWGLCLVLGVNGLGDVLLNHVADVRDQWADGWVC